MKQEGSSPSLAKAVSLMGGLQVPFVGAALGPVRDGGRQ